MLPKAWPKISYEAFKNWDTPEAGSDEYSEINNISEEEKSEKTAKMLNMKDRLMKDFPKVFADKLAPEDHMKVPKVSLQVNESYKMPKKAFTARELLSTGGEMRRNSSRNC